MDKMTEIATHCDGRDAWDCSTILEESISCIYVTTRRAESAKPALPLCLRVLGSSGFRARFPKLPSRELCDIRWLIDGL